MQLIFWILLALVIFTYLGYPVTLIIFNKLGLGRSSVQMQGELPTISFVIAAYNEEACIREKIENTLALHYDRSKINVVVVTDGSTDQTPQIVATYKEVILFHQDARQGKIAAINRVVPLLNSDVVVLSDANTILNQEALMHMGRKYLDPTVGAVSGEKVVLSADEDDATASEGLYWRYESAIKKLDSNLNTMVGCAGELMSFRKELYREVETDTYIEDFVLSMRIAAEGHKVAYCPEAKACELPSASIEDEMTRKVRIAAGGLQAVGRLRHLLNPFRYGLLTYQYVGHRVLRWTLAPLSLPSLLVINSLLLDTSDLYQILLAGQFFFYFIAMLGGSLKQKKIKVKGLFVPYYFLMMNHAVLLGFFRLVKGRQQVTWKKAQRRVALS